MLERQRRAVERGHLAARLKREGAVLRVIGRVLGVSRERARQIIAIDERRSRQKLDKAAQALGRTCLALRIHPAARRALDEWAAQAE